MGGDGASLEGEAPDRDLRTHVLETTVLSSFALAERLDLLQACFGDRCTWTEAVFAEITNGVAGEPHLGDLPGAVWLGPPEPTYNHELIAEVRYRLGGKGHDRRHLGEATTIALAVEQDLIVAIDDYDAKRLAENRGLGVVTTVSILRRCVREDRLAPDDAARLVEKLVDRYGRRLPRLSSSDFN